MIAVICCCRYIYRLAELHEREENFSEAGLTLLLHAESLEVGGERGREREEEE